MAYLLRLYAIDKFHAYFICKIISFALFQVQNGFWAIRGSWDISFKVALCECFFLASTVLSLWWKVSNSKSRLSNLNTSKMLFYTCHFCLYIGQQWFHESKRCSQLAKNSYEGPKDPPVTNHCSKHPWPIGLSCFGCSKITPYTLYNLFPPRGIMFFAARYCER